MFNSQTVSLFKTVRCSRLIVGYMPFRIPAHFKMGSPRVAAYRVVDARQLGLILGENGVVIALGVGMTLLGPGN